MSEHYEVRNNPGANRYEVEVEGKLAIAEYMLNGNNLTLTHTEVPVELEGRGIANALAEFAFNDAKTRELKVIALCPFMFAYVKRHPEHRSVIFGVQ